MKRLLLLSFLLPCLTLGLVLPAQAQTRNASFVNPATPRAAGEGKAGQTPTIMTADPAQIDAGETLVSVARRVTVFFFNGFRGPVQISNIELNADGNVRSKILSDDCKTLKELPSSDRCAVAVEVVPTSPGPWTVELLLTHTGQGRIARAELIGTTLGKTDEKSEGLSISKKIAPPLEFGSVRAGEEQATRTMLIENDSNEQLRISSIDLIASDGQGLVLRPSGCKEGDTLKPGESCPLTLMWQPGGRGNLSTDLIVRHDGNLGFVVVPIRGAATLAEGEKDGSGASVAARQNYSRGADTGSLMPRSSDASASPALDNLPMPSASQIARSLPPLDMNGSDKKNQASAGAAMPIKLIGTVGGRAILGGPDRDTFVVGLGETTEINGVSVELLQLDSRRAVVSFDGTRKELSLRNTPSYMQMKSTNSSGGGNMSGSIGAAPAPAAIEPQPTIKPIEGASAAPAIAPVTAQQAATLVN